MCRQSEAQRQVGGVRDADAHGHQRFREGGCVVADLQWRSPIDQVETVMAKPGEAECLAEPAGTGGKQAGRRIGRKAAIDGHLAESAGVAERFEGTQENGPGPPHGFAGDVSAEVATVDCVDVSMPCRAKEDLIARSGAPVGMRSRVGRVVVRAEIGLDFDNPTGEDQAAGTVDKKLA